MLPFMKLTRTQRRGSARTKCHGNTLACKIMHDERHPLYISKEDIKSAYERRKEEIESLRKYDAGEKEIKSIKLKLSLWSRIKNLI